MAKLDIKDKKGNKKISNLSEEIFTSENYDENIIKYNKHLLMLIKQFYGIISGITIGILGIQGINGFILYFLFNIIGTLITFHSIKNKTNLYFVNKSDIFFDEFFSGFVSFILFWTLSYDLLYIF